MKNSTLEIQVEIHEAPNGKLWALVPLLEVKTWRWCVGSAQTLDDHVAAVGMASRYIKTYSDAVVYGMIHTTDRIQSVCRHIHEYGFVLVEKGRNVAMSFPS